MVLPPFLKAQTIQLINPNGGEQLFGATSIIINWSYTNINNIKIEFSSDSGFTYQIVANSIPASSLTYNWTVPSIGSTKCFIKISDLGSSVYSRSANVFSIIPPTISIIYPNGGQQFKSKQGTFIQWQSTSISTIRVEYSSNNGSNWQTIATGVPANINYLNYTIPSIISSNYRVRLVAESNSAIRDSSHNTFSVTGNYPSPSPLKYQGGNYDGYAMRNNLADTIQILTPNGGQNLYGGATFVISWVYNNSENVKLEYSTDSGFTWNLIVANIPSSSLSYNWTVPSNGSNKCLIKITDNFSGINDKSDSTFRIIPPSITLIHPIGGEVFKSQQGTYVQWTSNSVNTVKVEYTNNGINWQTIANGVNANNRYLNFTIPSTISNLYRVRVLAESNSAVRDSSRTNFSVNGNYPNPSPVKYRGGNFDGYSMRNNLPDSIKLLTPNGGEQLEGGLNFNVTWNFKNVDNVKIEYSSDSGSVWNLIASNVVSSALTYKWNVPTIIGGSTKCLLKITDLQSGIYDISDANFTILPPSINVIFPNGGEQFKSQQGTYIKWNSTSVAFVNIDYSINNGASWANIASNVNSYNNYINWTIPTLTGNTYKVRVMASSNSSVGDSSNATFSNTGNYPTPNATKYHGGSYDGFDQYSISTTVLHLPNLPPFRGQIHCVQMLFKLSE